ncbi:ABC transporter permease [Paenibacillus sp. ACRRX]|uniref:ABC transporter permease n=1 Tax=Paenibacillus sp. ACRRX TaxID=2918206 RepID=UPI001EF5FD86|nr:ABC transporter permease [Paenibacillus sp. ACRRX]MCG7406630.1 ABC transporter permease [Paenibacillus sp. ACRRX]
MMLSHRMVKGAVDIVFTLLVVSILSFLLMRVSPIDPAEAFAIRNTLQPSSDMIAELRKELGLDGPLGVQYATWLNHALHFDFGKSLMNNKPVLDQFIATIPFTFRIVALSAVLQAVGAIILGCAGYMLRHRWSGVVVRVITIACISIPGFYLATVYLDIVAVKLHWISVVGDESLLKVWHPAFCLAVPMAAFYGRLLTGLLVKEMEEDYVMYARCQGLNENYILFRHGMPHVLLALLPNFMQSIGFTVAGATIIEQIFSVPGIGNVIITSVINRDAPMIHFSILLLAAVFMLTSRMSDAARLWLNRDAIRGNRE